MTDQRFLTLDEAAAILRVKDRRTVVSYARQGRIRIVGERRGIRVIAASIDEYERGESRWHHERNPGAASQARVSSGTSQGGAGRMKRSSDLVTDDPDTIPLLTGQKLQRT
jgi:helix-turn-helix protein